MSSETKWSYYADALPEYAHKLVRICGEQAERYTARSGWVDADGVQGEVTWTGDWDPIWVEDVDIVVANIDAGRPLLSLDYQELWRLRELFGAYLDAIEAGLTTADQIPQQSGLNTEVIAALKAVQEWDLSDEWRWCNTPVAERGEYPIFQAYVTLGSQCREIEDGLEGRS